MMMMIMMMIVWHLIHTTTTINTKNQQFIDEQFKIWELQEQINDYIHKIELK